MRRFVALSLGLVVIGGCSGEVHGELRLTVDASVGTAGTGSGASGIGASGTGGVGTSGTGASGSGATAGMGPRPTLDAGMPDSGPPPAPGAYPWYPALDLARIPFHAGAGPWGPQEQIAAPELPRVTDPTVYEVRSAADFEALAADGRQLVIKSGTVITASVATEVSDLDILIENGAVLGHLYVNAGSRIRVRGEVFGQHNTGRIDNMDFGNVGPVTDVIVDGLDSRPSGDQAALFASQINPVSRLSVTNMRVRGGIGLLVGTTDAVFAGSNFLNETTWWIMRNQGVWRRIVFFEVHMESYGQPVIRAHGSDAPMNSGAFWVGDSTLVASSQTFPEATGFCVRVGGGDTNRVVDSFWLDSVRIHAQGSLGAEIGSSSGECRYFRNERGLIVSHDYDAADHQTRAGAGDDWVISSTVVPLAGNPVPDWNDRNDVGDPREIQ